MGNDEDVSKKHPCRDCTFCQWCSDDRCRICRGGNRCRRKLSMAEQIELFDRLNADGEQGDGSDR